MRDELDGRLWAAHHEELSQGLDRLFDRIMDVFRHLHRYQWEAPWNRTSSSAAGEQVIAVMAALLFGIAIVTGAVAPAEARTEKELAGVAQAYYLA